MIHVFYTTFLERLPAAIWNYWYNMLTPAMQLQISKYRHWQDAQRSLLGKALLLSGCRKLNLREISLQDLVVNSYQKPYFPAGPAFNISHSGALVVCAVSSTNIIGIDVEEIKPIPLADFSDLFSEEELQTIFKNEDDFSPFYNLWTQKEAFVKAIGTGLHLPLRQVEVDKGQIRYNNDCWYIQQLNISSGYSCNVATDGIGVEILIDEILFNDV